MSMVSGFSFALLSLLALALPVCADDKVCAACHPNEVQGYSHVSMAHSLRRAAHEPSGSFQNVAGIKFTIYSTQTGTRQRMERSGEVSDFPVDYVIGSGTHASGYLIRIGDHLFQSPIAYYTKRHSYDMAPGYEKLTDADFTRPATEECLLCHSGKPLHIAATINSYQSPAFAPEAISCERCHGTTEEHLKRPLPGSIINPARLQGARRDSVCEQCHLTGAVRILDPGMRFEDFRPGRPLEEVYTVYRDAMPPGSPPGRFKVISHAEQLRDSACARNSYGKLWCGTCHDPHNKPVNAAPYYADRCLRCHAGKLPMTHTKTKNDCISCHMPRRNAFDGGHTIFTDHRIAKRPQPESSFPSPTDLAAWREPDAALQKRNLALAYLNAGFQRRSAAWIVRGYRMLTEVQLAFPDDIAVLNGFGTALLEGNQPREAKFAFDRVLQLDSSNPVYEENAGRADFACGDVEAATRHIERALQLDPLLLSAAGFLKKIYRDENDTVREAALAERIRQAMKQTRGK